MAPNPYDQVPLGQQTDALSAQDNQISYADMTRFQMVSQYQQQMQNYPRSSARYTQVLSQPRFQYGVEGQNTDFYQRQMQLNTSITGAKAFSGVADLASFGIATSMATQALRVAGMSTKFFSASGFVGTQMTPLAVAAVPMYFINKGVERTIERQRAMHSIASDVEQYRDRLGMGNVTTAQITGLGMNMTSSMYRPGQYFDPKKQQEILKYGLANDMLSGRGKGLAAGDVKTFEKNFTELLDTVKQVTKTMKVTAEGAMSVIKEMQQGGFGTMGQISTAMRSASAYGSMTGIGTQNMLQIGAAGAQAVQGTPYTAAAGASMYMGGAAMAGRMAGGGYGGAKMQETVRMAGGVAQAGGMIAQTTMNVLQSGIGARVLASVMDQNGKLNPGAFNELLSGKMSGHQIITRAGQVAHGWGSGGRVMFQRNRSELANQIAEDPIQAAMVMQSTFNAWRSNRRGTREQQAQVFAMNFGGGNEQQQNLIADWIQSDKGFSEMRAQQMVAGAVANDVGQAEGLSKRFGRQFSYGSWIGANIANASDVGAVATGRAYGAAVGVWGGVTRRFSNSAKDVIENVLKPWAPYGIYNRKSIGSIESGYKNLLGLNPINLTRQNMDEWAGLSAAQKAQAGYMTATSGLKNVNGWDPSLMGNNSREENARFVQAATTALGNGTTMNLWNDVGFLESARIRKGSDQYNKLKAGGQQTILDMLNVTQNKFSLQRKQSMTAMTNLTSFVSENVSREAEIKRMSELVANMDERQMSAIPNTIGANASFSQRTMTLLKQDYYGRKKLKQLEGVDSFSPGKMVGAESKRKEQEAANAMMNMGANMGGYNIAAAMITGVALGGLVVAGAGASTVTGGLAAAGAITLAGYAPALTDKTASYLKRRSVAGKMKELTGVDYEKDMWGAQIEIAKKIASGSYVVKNEEEMLKSDPARYREIKNWQNKVTGLYGLQGATWSDKQQDFEARFGAQIREKDDIRRRRKIGTKMTGMDVQMSRFLVEQGASSELVSAINAGAFQDKGYIPSMKLAEEAGALLAGGMTGREVIAEAKKGDFRDRLYNTSPQSAGNKSKLQNIVTEIDNMKERSKAKGWYYEDPEGGKRKSFRSQEQAEDFALKQYEREQKMQAIHDTASAEASKGKSLGVTAAAPILNYWNNKWSL